MVSVTKKAYPQHTQAKKKIKYCEAAFRIPVTNAQ